MLVKYGAKSLFKEAGDDLDYNRSSPAISQQTGLDARALDSETVKLSLKVCTQRHLGKGHVEFVITLTNINSRQRSLQTR